MINVLVLGMLLTSQPAPAGDGATGASAEAAAQPAPRKAKEKKICRPVPGTSSRIPQRVCRTEREWENAQQSGATQADLQRMGAN